MKNILLLIILGIVTLNDIQSQSDTSRVQFYQYPEFMLPIEDKMGETTIMLYNFDEQSKIFAIENFNKYARNFTGNTFYIKKIVKSQSLDLSGSWEYFKTGNNQWREVSLSPSGFQLREILVTDEITLRDTSILFNPETYEDFYHIIDYHKIK